MGYSARILKDSISKEGVRLTTMEVTFPRITLAEFNTHRVFSRNSASSRAIPIAKMLQRVQEDPFIPVYWGKNQSGMQALEELSPEAQTLALEQWLKARDNAVESVKRLQLPDIDLHKQIANRLLEPWLYHTVIVTSTEWDNWDALRTHPDAQPEIRKIAVMMSDIRNASKPKQLGDGEWHLPLVTDYSELVDAGFTLDEICLISVGRCARVSYLTHDGKRDPKADSDLALKLQNAGHISPFEHVARPATVQDWQYKLLRTSGVVGVDKADLDISEAFFGNFRGWIQRRYSIPNEENFGKTLAAQQLCQIPR
jgi:thymidylate synthase ThyX